MSSDCNPVLSDAYAVLAISDHVSLNTQGIHSLAQRFTSSTSTPSIHLPQADEWARSPLHPTPSLRTPKEVCDWVFLVSLLNFSFWSELDDEHRYAVRWRCGVDGKGQSESDLMHGRGNLKDWKGYWALPAAVNRALEDGIPITNPHYWTSATEDDIAHVFRPSPGSCEAIPLLSERVRMLRETGTILCRDWSGSFYNLLQSSEPRYDALSIVKMVVSTLPAFRDESIHPKIGRVRLWKRAQILVAELWAAFASAADVVSSDGLSVYAHISNISSLTMFADYRVPQILHDLSLITYSAHLHSVLSSKTLLENGSTLELSIRCASIVAVEELRRAIVQASSDNAAEVNAVLLDFWLWNEAKTRERDGASRVECHRVRSVWY